MTFKTQLNYQDGDLSRTNEMNQNGYGLWSQKDYGSHAGITTFLAARPQRS